MVYWPYSDSNTYATFISKAGHGVIDQLDLLLYCFPSVLRSLVTAKVKTVRVTAAVCGGLGRLKPTLTHPYWTGLRSYTHPFGLAAPYVFVKQSDPPSHCDLLLLPRGEQ